MPDLAGCALHEPRRGHLHARLAPGALFSMEGDSEPVERRKTCLHSRGVLIFSLLLPFCLHLICPMLFSLQRVAMVPVEERVILLPKQPFWKSDAPHSTCPSFPVPWNHSGVRRMGSSMPVAIPTLPKWALQPPWTRRSVVFAPVLPPWASWGLHVLAGKTCFPVRIQSSSGDRVGHQQSWPKPLVNKMIQTQPLILQLSPCLASYPRQFQGKLFKSWFTFTVFPPQLLNFFFIAMTILLVFHWRCDKINQQCKPLLQYPLCCSQPEFTVGLSGWNLVACNMCRADSPMTSLPLSLGNLWALSWPLDHPSLPLLVLYFLSYSFKTLFGPKLFFTSHTLSLISNMEGKLFKNRLQHRQCSGN